MKEKTFLDGMALLKEVFRRDFNRKIYWLALQDIDDTSFRDAVLDIIKTQKELYPNTNMIAIIRERSQMIRMAHLSRTPEVPAIQDMRPAESVPPPPEFYAMMKQLKQRTTERFEAIQGDSHRRAKWSRN